MPIDNVNRKTLHGAATKHVAENSAVFTDELASHNGHGTRFGGRHHTVNHSQNEYAWIDENGLPVTTNTAESFFRCGSARITAFTIK